MGPPPCAQPAPRIGAHVSLGPRPAETIARIRRQGFACLQIHACSPRQWRIPRKTEEDFLAVRSACDAAGMDIYLHAIYLINLASDDDAIYEASKASLIWNMLAGAKMGARGVVVHIGSHRGRGFDDVRSRISAAVEMILAASPAGAALLLENSAGAGGTIGGEFAHLGAILADLGWPANLGICVDTAHAYAMGHDPRSPDGVDRLIDSIDETAGMDRLRLLHLNDSKTELGAHRDRHENIGAGRIGVKGFANLLDRPALRRLPLILETPNVAKREEELAILCGLVAGRAGGAA